MPIKRTDKGWYWGSKGPFKSKRKAQKVAQAAYASGYQKSFQKGNITKVLESVLYDLRKQVCESCPYGGKRCDLCGCYINTKINLLNSTCPINKWPSPSNTSINASKHNKTNK